MNGEDRIRTPRKNTGKTGVSIEGGAECGALGAQTGQIDPDLQAIIERWPTLPEPIRAGILAMIRAGRSGGSCRMRNCGPTAEN